jgi:hypothetical protein
MLQLARHLGPAKSKSMTLALIESLLFAKAKTLVYCTLSRMILASALASLRRRENVC